MIRPTADNVVIRFLPEPTRSETGLLHLPENRRTPTRQARRAEVMAVGPGYYERLNLRTARAFGGLVDARYKFVPTEVKVGEVVLVDAIAGQDYSLDLDVPRHNKHATFDAIADERGQFRIVREAEIHGVLEVDDDDTQASAAQ